MTWSSDVYLLPQPSSQRPQVIANYQVGLHARREVLAVQRLWPVDGGEVTWLEVLSKGKSA